MVRNMVPPPYIPPQYRKCKYCELPPECKAEVDNWIGISLSCKEREADIAARRLPWVWASFIGLMAVLMVAVVNFCG